MKDKSNLKLESALRMWILRNTDEKAGPQMH